MTGGLFHLCSPCRFDPQAEPRSGSQSRCSKTLGPRHFEDVATPTRVPKRQLSIATIERASRAALMMTSDDGTSGHSRRLG